MRRRPQSVPVLTQLRTIRTHRGLRLDDLAAATKKSRPMICAYERGYPPTRASTVSQLAKKLQVEPRALYSEIAISTDGTVRVLEPPDTPTETSSLLAAAS